MLNYNLVGLSSCPVHLLFITERGGLSPRRYITTTYYSFVRLIWNMKFRLYCVMMGGRVGWETGDRRLSHWQLINICTDFCWSCRRERKLQIRVNPMWKGAAKIIFQAKQWQQYLFFYYLLYVFIYLYCQRLYSSFVRSSDLVATTFLALPSPPKSQSVEGWWREMKEWRSQSPHYLR